MDRKVRDIVMMTRKSKADRVVKRLFRVICMFLCICFLLKGTEVSAMATQPNDNSYSPVVGETDNNAGNVLGINISTTEDGG